MVLPVHGRGSQQPQGGDHSAVMDSLFGQTESTRRDHELRPQDHQGELTSGLSPDTAEEIHLDRIADLAGVGPPE